MFISSTTLDIYPFPSKREKKNKKDQVYALKIRTYIHRRPMMQQLLFIKKITKAIMSHRKFLLKISLSLRRKSI